MLACTSCADERFAEEQMAAPPLFEIANSKGEVEGWMLGTIHSLPDGTDWRTDEIERVLNLADTLYVEVANLDDSTYLQQTFINLATTPGQPMLTSRIRPSQREELRDLVARSSYSIEDFNSIETWAAALMLARVSSFGEAENGVDLALLSEFPSESVFEFEGAEKQLGIFDQLDERDQRDLLQAVVEDTRLAEVEPDRLAKAWFTGDTQALVTATTTGMMGDPELRAALLVQRNVDWVEQLRPVLDASARPLIAVGAGHLVGDDSMIDLLVDRGYTLRSLH